MWAFNEVDYDNNYLAHHGIKGQKWGVRRYQNPDGTLTKAGKRRYSKYEKQQMRTADLAITANEYRRMSANSANTLESIDKNKYQNEIKSLDNAHKQFWNSAYNSMREYNRVNSRMNSKFGDDHMSKYGSEQYKARNSSVNNIWDRYQHPIEDAEAELMKAKQTKDRKKIKKAKKARNTALYNTRPY